MPGHTDLAALCLAEPTANGAKRNWQSGLKPLLGYQLINLLLELIEQSNRILGKWFHTFRKELQCVSMAEIVAESKVWLQVIQQ